MLLSFSVENHRSIRDRAELSMVASSLKDREEGLIACAAVPGGKVLPSAVIYGANASGKSNVIAGLAFMRRAVHSSHVREDLNEPTGRTAFALNAGAKGSVSRLEIDFMVGSVRYHYGFVCSDAAFEEEWLHAFPRGRDAMLFDRVGQKFDFGRTLRGRNKLISELTRPNSLFLSTAAQNDHDELSLIHMYIGSIIIRYSFLGWTRSTVGDLFERRYASRIVALLQKADTGIVDHRFVLPRDRPRLALATLTAGSLDSDPSDVLELGHRTTDDKVVFLDLVEESSGTRRLVTILGSVFEALDKGRTILIDELEVNLHTKISEEIVALFASPKSNPKGAQLIATTHDTNLLRSSFLRRDQIWFTEKDNDGATHLYPLTDLKTRSSDNLEKGYLQGRYGAIPFAGPTDAFSRS